VTDAAESETPVVATPPSPSAPDPVPGSASGGTRPAKRFLFGCLALVVASTLLTSWLLYARIQRAVLVAPDDVLAVAGDILSASFIPPPGFLPVQAVRIDLLGRAACAAEFRREGEGGFIRKIILHSASGGKTNEDLDALLERVATSAVEGYEAKELEADPFRLAGAEVTPRVHALTAAPGSPAWRRLTFPVAGAPELVLDIVGMDVRWDRDEVQALLDHLFAHRPPSQAASAGAGG
jgi:hypothetical protein